MEFYWKDTLIKVVLWDADLGYLNENDFIEHIIYNSKSPEKASSSIMFLLNVHKRCALKISKYLNTFDSLPLVGFCFVEKETDNIEVTGVEVYETHITIRLEFNPNLI